MRFFPPNAFLTRIDGVVRFLYCRTPILSSLFQRFLFWKLYASDPKKMTGFYNALENFDFSGKTVLEFGPGNTRMNAYYFLMRGAKKVILVDKYSRVGDSERQKKFEQDELKLIQEWFPGESLWFLTEEGKLKPGFIEFRIGDVQDMKFEPVDFMYSLDVFEHVQDVTGFVVAISKSLKHDGVMFHQINMGDHFNAQQPHLFLRYSNWTWRHLLTKPGISFTNRIRYNEYLDVFNRHGFKVIWEEREKIPLGDQRVHRDFHEREDFDTVRVRVLLKKIGDAYPNE